MPTRFRTANRRQMLQGTALAGVGLALSRPSFAQSTIVSDSERITAPYGVQIGDLAPGRAMLWSKANKAGRINVRWSTAESMRTSFDTAPVHVLEDSDFTAKIDLAGLPSDQRIFYEVEFTDLEDRSVMGEPLSGSFLSPPQAKRNIRFLWSGDTAGQGWGINPDFGGMRIYETMRQTSPDFFIHSGDTIYADGPIQAEVELGDGTIWRNVTTLEKSKVAETLADFRGNYAYNLMDENVRRFNAEVPMFAQWDDHEVTNNWYWEMRKDQDERYKEGSVALMAARAMRAFHDYMPTRQHPLERDRLYNNFSYGPSLEIFRLDMRSYRGANSDAQPTQLSPESRILGERQMRWLTQALEKSTATWKIVASDMPIGLIVYGNWQEKKEAEAIALRDGPAAGREVEIAELLTHIRDKDIKNTVFLTADVHYTSAHKYDPARAHYQAFKPFWEFVSGPLNSGSFGPNELDNTFGPEAVFVKAPEAGQVNLPPSAGLQFFGQVDIDGESEILTVTLKDIDGQDLFSQELTPEA